MCPSAPSPAGSIPLNTDVPQQRRTHQHLDHRHSGAAGANARPSCRRRASSTPAAVAAQASPTSARGVGLLNARPRVRWVGTLSGLGNATAAWHRCAELRRRHAGMFNVSTLGFAPAVISCFGSLGSHVSGGVHRWPAGDADQRRVRRLRQPSIIDAAIAGLRLRSAEQSSAWAASRQLQPRPSPTSATSTWARRQPRRGLNLGGVAASAGRTGWAASGTAASGSATSATAMSGSATRPGGALPRIGSIGVGQRRRQHVGGNMGLGGIGFRLVPAPTTSGIRLTGDNQGPGSAAELRCRREAWGCSTRHRQHQFNTGTGNWGLVNSGQLQHLTSVTAERAVPGSMPGVFNGSAMPMVRGSLNAGNTSTRGFNPPMSAHRLVQRRPHQHRRLQHGQCQHRAFNSGSASTTARAVDRWAHRLVGFSYSIEITGGTLVYQRNPQRPVHIRSDR